MRRSSHEPADGAEGADPPADPGRGARTRRGGPVDRGVGTGRRLPREQIELGGEYLRTLWGAFAENMPLLRHQLASDAGRDMRAARFEASRQWFVDGIASRGIDAESDGGRRLVRLALLLTSSLAFVDLHDRQGVDAETAAADVTWAVTALEAASRSGGA